MHKCKLPSLGAVVNSLDRRPDSPTGRHLPHEQMMGILLLSLLILAVSVISGMLGIGVAFAAIPILGMHSQDLVHEVQPIALFLNGVTALFAASAFARAGYVEWRRSIGLAGVCTLCAPIGSWAAQYADERTLWLCYFGSVIVVVYLLISRRSPGRATRPFAHVLLASAPIAALSGFLGVGPGFLLVPVMMHSGFSPRRAAAMNAVAVTPSSFASLIPHLDRAVVEPAFAVPIVLSAACGALAGGYLASRRVPEKALRLLFVAIILALAAYKLLTLSAQGPVAAAVSHGRGQVVVTPQSR